MTLIDRARRHLVVILLALGTLVLYGFGLSWAPVHPHFDELRFAEQSMSVASTWRDTNGRLLPIYFQMEASVWFHPVGVYLPAIAFKLFGVSTAAMRAPTALLGVLDVVLVYFIARRMFRSDQLAFVSAALLATAPVHVIHSRIAMDYLFPTPFVLGWCLLLLRALDTGSRRTLFAATSILAFACYSYIAAVALLPLFLVVTMVVLWVEGWGPRAIAVAVAGSLWPLIPAAVFISTHPEMLVSTLGRYGIAATQLDAFQRIRETLTPWFVSDRANLYSTFFAPGYLFVTGGSGLVGSTRTAGVFLLCSLPLMLIGLRGALIKYSPHNLVLLAGVLLPPVAATVVAEQFSAGRAMSMVPFAILLAAKGVDDLRAWSPSASALKLIAVSGVVVALIGLLYCAYRATAGEISPGGVAVIAAGLAAIGIARMMRRTGRMSPIAAALLIACALQFVFFTRDYFGDYRARSAFWFNGNLKGAIIRVVEAMDRSAVPGEVWLDQEVTLVDRYWRFHLAELDRSELAPRMRVLRPEQMKTQPMPAGTWLIAPALDDALKALAESRGMTLIATATDPGDDPPAASEQPSYFVFERR
jgi:4-amino-4-deoxy-L-arabinose transferase-like glycosyltransferase